MSQAAPLKSFILAEIRRVADANEGQAPGSQRFEKETGIRKSQWYGLMWARWGDALVEAGLSPNTLMAKADPDHLLTKFAEAARHFGRIPPDGELRLYARTVDPSYPGHTTFNAAFGSKAGGIERLREWLQDKSEFADVSALLPPPTVPVASRPRKSTAADGSVYLIRSGKHFKIGRSDQIEQRIKSIRVSLPEASLFEHEIKTDDPPGIEAYWHRRFADRRANGEWFALTAQDVLIFKRRKFQ